MIVGVLVLVLGSVQYVLNLYGCCYGILCEYLHRVVMSGRG